MLILTKDLAYPIESLYKNFNVVWHDSVAWSGGGVTDPYICLEVPDAEVDKLIKYFDIIEYAEIIEDKHVWYNNTEKNKRNYQGMLENATEEAIKQKRTLHFIDNKFHLVVNKYSAILAPSLSLQ